MSLARLILAALAPDYTGDPEPREETPAEWLERQMQWCQGEKCQPPTLIGAWRGTEYVVWSCNWCKQIGVQP